MTSSPGWYRDPAEPSTQRYWDGEGWVGEPLPIDATPPPGPPAVSIVQAPKLPETPAPPTSPTFTPPTPIPTMPVKLTVPVRPHGFALASPGARFMARFIDILAVLVLNAVVNGWFVYRFMLDFGPYMQAVIKASQAGEDWAAITQPSQMRTLTLVITLLMTALWFAYEVPVTAQTGQTLGKRAMRIKVVRVESLEPLGFMRSWRRWNPLGLPTLLLSCCPPVTSALQALDVMFIPMDRLQRMALHDRSAGTYVVQLPEPVRLPDPQKGK
ncbi:RDD family protein [Allorhizocola rhizosphaerae]|uniref:RDD family protein n=1 Tax=Allorhizocola rhizosphaerae TaxID=1872709 RepID=UPI000E3D1FE3|nr:RDD family protein [Allorhizocola rhizosphaerae]